MRVLLSLLLACFLAVALLQPVQGDIFTSIARKVRGRLGHRGEHVPSLPHHDTNPAVDEVKHTLPMMPSLVLPSQEEDAAKPSKHRCKECKRWFASHLLKETVNATLTFCANTQCPKLKERCEWIKKNLNFSVGYIAQKIRPQRSAQLFCEGAKKCAIPPYNKTDSYLPLVHDDEQRMYSDVEEDMEHVNDMFTGADDMSTAIASVTSESSSSSSSSSSDKDVELLGKADLMDGELDPDVSAIHFMANMHADDFQQGENGVICAGCVHLGACHIVSGIWKRTAEFCKNPKNPKWAARCEWTFAHKQFSTGYIYSRFTPGKVSYGYCMGKGLCPHPKNAMMMTPVPMFDLGGI